jgi:tetratricopeptide (TPR) repeat protein
MPAREELIDAYEAAATLAEAEQALTDLRASGESDPDELGELYDELATAAAEEDDFELAVRAQREAIGFPYRHRRIGEEMLGWYLLKAGQRAEGEAHFERLRAERPDDIELLFTIGNARADSGDEEGSLAAHDAALALARRAGDADAIRMAMLERAAAREDFGLEPDEDDRLASSMHAAPAEDVRFALAFFPRGQHEAALARWPDLEDDLGDSDEYFGAMESRLRVLRSSSGRNPLLSPIEVDRFVAFAAEHGLDSGSGETRAHYSAELSRLGRCVAWPPGRNDPCWCGSQRKYKRCCGAL